MSRPASVPSSVWHTHLFYTNPSVVYLRVQLSPAAFTVLRSLRYVFLNFERLLIIDQVTEISCNTKTRREDCAQRRRQERGVWVTSSCQETLYEVTCRVLNHL